MRENERTLRYRVFGLDCAEEVAMLKRELSPLVGEERLAFDLLRGKLTVTASESDVAVEQIAAAIRRTGLSAEPWRDVSQDAAASLSRSRARLALTIASGVATAMGIGIELLAGEETSTETGTWTIAARAAYGAAIVVGLWLVAPKALLALRRFRPDMNLLMTIAVAGAVIIGEWLEGASVAFLFALANLLESWSVGRARRAIAALLKATPQNVRVRDFEGAVIEKAPEDVPIGAAFVVRPGERIALDGRVSHGESEVNQAPITGESQPVSRSPGDPVFAGSINGEGALEVESTADASDTVLARMVRMVEEAQSRRSQAERWVERFARFYVPAVLAIALLIFLLPPLLGRLPWSESAYRALVLLVIACPCALVISTPVSVVAGLASAAKRGVLIKGGVYLELPARLRAIAFDKTGTLTRGAPEVVGALALEGWGERALLEIATSLEAQSDHPLARAVVAFAVERGIAPQAVRDANQVAGGGVSGTIDGKTCWIGSFERSPIPVDERLREEFDEQTAAAVICDGRLAGAFAFSDALRSEALPAIDALRALGVKRIAMLTGDRAEVARRIASEAGIDETHADLMPEDKVALVEKLVGEEKFVAMVGDGVNDAPALARASLGVAMGAAGSDAALETADVALLGDDLSLLPWLIAHSRRTLSIIRQNVVFALAVKAIFFALAVAGYSSLWLAIAADTGASLLVVFNGLRLLKAK